MGRTIDAEPRNRTEALAQERAIIEAPVTVMLDTQAWHRKPTNDEVRGISWRLKHAGPVTLPLRELLHAVIAEGRTWMPHTFEPATEPKGWGKFVSASLMALDFDNTLEWWEYVGEPDEKGRRKRVKRKRQLQMGEDGFVTPHDVELRAHRAGLLPIVHYHTFSASETAARFRVVFWLGETVTDEGEAKENVEGMLALFPEADKACRDLTRLCFGGNGTAYRTRFGECWRTGGGANG